MNRAAAFAANAPLMSVPGAAAPPNVTGEWYRGAGGLRLRAALWAPQSGKPRGTVILSPGRTEPIEKYYELIGDLLERDFCVLAHDWRGQGLSARLLPDRLKGHARAVEEFLDDYSRLLDEYTERAPAPWIMLGHSMGGVLNLLTLEGGETRFSACLLSSPMLRLRTGRRSLWSVRFAARWNVRHGKAGDYVFDEYDDPFEHTFERDGLTHDEQRYERWREQLYACPHLAVGGITWGWLAFAVDAGEERAMKPKALRRVKTPAHHRPGRRRRPGAEDLRQMGGAAHGQGSLRRSRRRQARDSDGAGRDAPDPDHRVRLPRRSGRGASRRHAHFADRLSETSASSRHRVSPAATIWPVPSTASPRQFETLPPAPSITGINGS